MNYYERHLGDYARDTAHLSLLEHGVYTLLMDRYYATEAGIPADEAHRLARARSKEERDAVDTVLREFFTLECGVHRQKRCDAEIERARARIEAARQNGRSGGRPRKKPAGFSGQPDSETQPKPTGFELGSDPETHPKALHTPESRAPVSRSQSPISKSQFPDHSEAASVSGETQAEPRLAEVRTAIGDFDLQRSPSKSPQRESKKPQNALEFEQINDRVERLLVELSGKGSPVNQHDYAQIASLSGLTEKQARKAVEQLIDRRRLPIAECRRAAS